MVVPKLLELAGFKAPEKRKMWIENNSFRNRFSRRRPSNPVSLKRSPLLACRGEVRFVFRHFAATLRLLHTTFVAESHSSGSGSSPQNPGPAPAATRHGDAGTFPSSDQRTEQEKRSASDEAANLPQMPQKEEISRPDGAPGKLASCFLAAEIQSRIFGTIIRLRSIQEVCTKERRLP